MHGEVHQMNIIKKSLSVAAVVSLATMSFAVPAEAATKKLTCYKGTQTKVVTTAKCPTGWSTKKPAAAPTKSAAASTASTTAINATYTGKLALLWSDAGVQATSVTADSTSGNAGLSSLDGKGSSSPQSKCDIILGAGTLSGGGNTVKVEFDSSTKGCADDESGPTDITLTGNAIIKGGTGKFANATGTLKVTGSFHISSTASGTSEKVTLKLTISGNIVTK